MEHLWGLQDGVPWYSEAGPGHGPASGPGPAEESLTTAHSHSARGPFLGTNETWHQEVPPTPVQEDPDQETTYYGRHM